MLFGQAPVVGVTQVGAADGLGDRALDLGAAVVGLASGFGVLCGVDRHPCFVDRLGVDGDPTRDVRLGEGALLADRAGPAVPAGEYEGDKASLVGFHRSAGRAGGTGRPPSCPAEFTSDGVNVPCLALRPVFTVTWPTRVVPRSAEAVMFAALG